MSHRIQVPLPAELKERVKKDSKKRGLKESQWVRSIVTKYYANLDKKAS
jgi:predicted DNA-binding protein